MVKFEVKLNLNACTKTMGTCRVHQIADTPGSEIHPQCSKDDSKPSTATGSPWHGPSGASSASKFSGLTLTTSMPESSCKCQRPSFVSYRSNLPTAPLSSAFALRPEICTSCPRMNSPCEARKARFLSSESDLARDASASASLSNCSSG